MEQLKLTVNETKTHIRELPQDRFDFLGYSFGRYYTPRTGQAYLCPQPSKKSVQRLIGEIREATDRKTAWQEAEAKVKQITRHFCDRDGTGVDPPFVSPTFSTGLPILEF